MKLSLFITKILEMLVKLIGKSNKGKQRVKQHGELWNVERISNTSLFTQPIDGPGPFLFMRPNNGSDDCRWVSEVGDPNFDVIKEEQ